MLCQTLNIRPGVTAVIGSGGKTATLRVLAEELSTEHSVLLCTTTKIYPPKDMLTLLDPTEAEVARALETNRLVCIGVPAPNGKLGVCRVPFSRLEALAEYVLTEADGSKQLPLKAHEPHEPVIPPESRRVIQLVGLSGVGRTIREAAHRPERYAALAGTGIDAVVTPQIAARVISRENLADSVIVNQAENRTDEALELISALEVPAWYGSVRCGMLYKGEKMKCLL